MVTQFLERSRKFPVDTVPCGLSSMAELIGNRFPWGFIGRNFLAFTPQVKPRFRDFLPLWSGPLLVAGRLSSPGAVRQCGNREVCRLQRPTAAHSTGAPLGNRQQYGVRAGDGSLVGKDVFVIGHGIHVAARLAGPRPGVGIRRGAGLSTRPTRCKLTKSCTASGAWDR